jgi:hypothetical protein
MVPDDEKFSRFHEDDRRDIIIKIQNLGRKQAGANILVETFPRGRPFPF